jgi:hypothetical protein
MKHFEKVIFNYIFSTYISTGRVKHFEKVIF